MSRSGEDSVLTPEEDPLGRVLHWLVALGMLTVSGVSFLGAVLTAVRGMWLIAWTFFGVGSVFSWQLHKGIRTPQASLSRTLSRRNLQRSDSPPNTRLEQTRGHDAE